MIIKLADIRIAVNNIYPYIEKYCADYICYDRRRADFTVDISDEDIARERAAVERTVASEGNSGIEFGDPYLETLAVYRKIAERMPSYDTVLFHGSALAIDGDGYLFTAKSGTGKSTHTRLWRERFGDRVVMINDDKPLLHIDAGSVIAYGTPWNGKHRLGTNASVPLRGLCVLGRTYRPHDPAALVRTLELVDRIAEIVPLWSLQCNMESCAASCAYLGMQSASQQKGN